LRSIIVNKATEGESSDGRIDLNKLESSFRLELEKEFRPLQFADTHPVPVDIEALKAYKTQRIPYLAAPASPFAFATLSAFRDILQLVTAKWTEEQVAEWNHLIETVSSAINERNVRTAQELEEHARRAAEVVELRNEVGSLRERISLLTRENERLERSHERELERVGSLMSVTRTESRKSFVRWRSALIAALLAAILGFPIGAYFLSSVAPLMIYIVASSRNDPDLLGALQTMAQASSEEMRVGGTPIQTRVELLEEDTADAAQAKAKQILNRKDALLVIGYINSLPTEASLPVYFGTRPQIPFIAALATANDLLTQCNSSCFVAPGIVPLLQLPPTNEAQAVSGLQFARAHGLHKFLIVSDRDLGDSAYSAAYSEDLAATYEREIERYNSDKPNTKSEPIELVGKSGMGAVDDELARLGPDCVLYTGYETGAKALLANPLLYSKHMVVILSDASLTAATLGRLRFEHPPVYFTYSMSAADYNTRRYGLARDAFFIAHQLISDMNARGLGTTFGLRSPFHSTTPVDVRRDLARVMLQNSESRSSYLGPSGVTYIFSGYKRVGAPFHVLQPSRFGDLVDADTAPDIDFRSARGLTNFPQR
jgi:hypothetical protein